MGCCPGRQTLSTWPWPKCSCHLPTWGGHTSPWHHDPWAGWPWASQEMRGEAVSMMHPFWLCFQPPAHPALCPCCPLPGMQESVSSCPSETLRVAARCGLACGGWGPEGAWGQAGLAPEPAWASPRPTGTVGSLGRLLSRQGESCLSGGSGWNFQRCSSAPARPSSPRLPQPEPTGACCEIKISVASAAGPWGASPWSAGQSPE